MEDKSQKEEAGTGQIEFHGPAPIADGMDGYVAVFNKLKLVETGVTKQEALDEIVISFAVLVAYQAELKVPDFIPRKDAGQQAEDAGYWKKRALAGELVMSHVDFGLGVKNRGQQTAFGKDFDNWQSLKNQQP